MTANPILPWSAIAVLLSLVPAFSQGLLTPPGPPGPTGKTLDQIEPRIDVQRAVNPLPGDVSTQYILGTPGSYYLSAPLATTKATAIRITASGVSLDLAGFPVSRASGVGGPGISISAGVARTVVRDGSITGFTTGLQATGARGGSFSGLTVSGCTVLGINAGDVWEITGCRAHDNGSTGISGGESVAVRDCVAADNGSGGFTLLSSAVLDNCVATGNSGTSAIQTGSNAVLTACIAAGNTVATGIQASFGSTLRDCVARDNTSAATISQGIFVNGQCVITGCVASGNLSINATLTGSTGIGIRVVGNATILDCVARGNRGDGIQAGTNCIVRGNLCDTNGTVASDGAGLHITSSGCRIEGNHLTSNRRGIVVDGDSNLIIQNTAKGNAGFAYVIANDNHFGPVINRAGAGTAGFSGSAAASNLTTTDPRANFAH